MHIVQNLTGVTSISDIQIQKNFSHLILVKTGTSATIDAETVIATIKGLSQEQNIVPDLKVRDVAVMSSWGGGYQLQQVEAGGLVKTAFQIECSVDGGLALYGSNEYVSVDLNNLQAGATYNLYAYEHLQDSRKLVKYQTEVIVGTSSRQVVYPLGSNSMSFAIRNNGALAKIILTGNNGKQVTYLPEELACIGREMNGYAIGPDKLLEGDAFNQMIGGGASELFVLPSMAYRQVEVWTTGLADLYMIKANVFAY